MFHLAVQFGASHHNVGITKEEAASLNEILGFKPKVNISSCFQEMRFIDQKTMHVVNGTFFEIIAKNAKYKIANAPFSIETREGKNIKSADGLFEGPFDETGQKVANIFFSKLEHDSIVYVNDDLLQIQKNEEGIIAFIKI